MSVLDANGLTVKTRQQILDELLNGYAGLPGMRQIYGSDINVDANSPDGQLLNIVAQVAADMWEVLARINSGMDPDQAIGTILDSRAAINGVVRQGATRTIQNVDVTVTQALTLPGTDAASPFTVSDDNGNQFQLISSYAFGAAGTQTLAFQAVQTGAIETTIGGLTNIVTPIAGVAGVNNSVAATSIGKDQESDASLRIRRAKSVSLPSQGFIEGLVGALTDIEGVRQAIVLENITNATDGNGIPAHSIWAIVDADSSLNADVADAIYKKRNAGCGMKGAISVPVSRPGGGTINILFDHPTPVTLYISLTIAAVTGSFDATYIRNQLLELLSYQIGQTADVSTIVALIKQIAPNVVVTSPGVSLSNAGYAGTLAAPTVASLFGPTLASVYINGSHG